MIAHDKSHCIMWDVNEETESEETEQDEELYKISSTLLTWQAYYEWLKLMVVHFDAVHVLISFRERVWEPITIKVISTPQPDKLLMPWKKLLENERYFCNQLLPTSAIIAFLEEWWDGQKTGNPHIEAVISNWCSLKPDRVLDSELDSIIKKMINMKCYQLPGSDNVVEELLSDVESSKGGKLMLRECQGFCLKKWLCIAFQFC